MIEKTFLTQRRYNISDKDLLKLLGLDNKTISMSIDDEYAQLMIRREIEKYEKEVEREKQKDSHEEYKEKAHLVEMLKSKMVINVIKDIMIKEGFSYRCPTCLDLSGQYGRPIQSYSKYNKR